MTGLFNGIATLASGIFGDPVGYSRGRHGAYTPVQSIFRREPVEVNGDGGPVLTEAPFWRVPKTALSAPPERGDHIRPSDGKTYRITAVHPTRSPADDRFWVCVLEELLP